MEHDNDNTIDENARRDATARGLAPRLYCCSVDELRLLDVLLTQFEHERDGSRDIKPLNLQLQRDRYNEDEGSITQMAYRRGWNDSSRHAEAMGRIHDGLVEFRRQAVWPDTSPAHDLFDLGGES